MPSGLGRPQPSAVAGVGREEVRLLLADGAQLVEVLGREEFDDEHLPGAVSLPLQAIDRASVATLDPRRPIVVYCYDTQ